MRINNDTWIKALFKHIVLTIMYLQAVNWHPTEAVLQLTTMLAFTDLCWGACNKSQKKSQVTLHESICQINKCMLFL